MQFKKIMKTNGFLNKKKVATVIILVCLTIVAVAVQHNITATGNKLKKSVSRGQSRKHKLDPEILNQLEAVVTKIGSHKIYSITGSVTAIDEADTAQVISNVPLIVFQGNNQMYYRMGDTETIVDNGLSLTIDHNIKKILLSANNNMQTPVTGSIMNIRAISEALRSEKYTLTSTAKGEKQTITLINEHHITCKEYSLTYDAGTLMPSRIYTRLTNFDDPLKTNNEKVIDIRVTNWNTKLHMSNYAQVKAIVSKVDGEWKATGKYEGYTIIEI
jgi:hypothetical protein